MIGGETDIPFKIASCCKPKQKHPIIAYNSRGLEFVVHRTNCKLLKDLEQERFMEANFVQTATLIINSKDHFGFLQKILEFIRVLMQI